VAIFFGFYDALLPKTRVDNVEKRRPHKAQKGRRWKNRQPSQNALKFT
jgi:hypothetical protein